MFFIFCVCDMLNHAYLELFQDSLLGFGNFNSCSDLIMYFGIKSIAQVCLYDMTLVHSFGVKIIYSVMFVSCFSID